MPCMKYSNFLITCQHNFFVSLLPYIEISCPIGKGDVSLFTWYKLHAWVNDTHSSHEHSKPVVIGLLNFNLH